jgi:hypothetical protein
MKNLVSTLYKVNAGFETKKLAGSIYRQAELTEFLLITLKETPGEDISYKLETADFNELMENLLQTFADFADTKNVVLLKKNYAKGSVFLDKKRFEQACFNIICRWCNILVEGGRIYIKTENDEKMIRIEFKKLMSVNSFYTEISENKDPEAVDSVTEEIIGKFGGSIEASYALQEQKFIIYLPLSSY